MVSLNFKVGFQNIVPMSEYNIQLFSEMNFESSEADLENSVNAGTWKAASIP